MPNLQVGQVIKFREQSWICTKITRSQTEEIAKCDSKEYRELYIDLRVTNRMMGEIDIGEFKIGETIAVEIEVVQLQVPGQNIFFIYNKWKARRVNESVPDSTAEPAVGGGAEAEPHGVSAPL